MTCEVVDVPQWVTYEHPQPLQLFNVEEERAGGGALRSRKESRTKMGRKAVYRC